MVCFVCFEPSDPFQRESVREVTVILWWSLTLNNNMKVGKFTHKIRDESGKLSTTGCHYPPKLAIFSDTAEKSRYSKILMILVLISTSIINIHQFNIYQSSSIINISSININISTFSNFHPLSTPNLFDKTTNLLETVKAASTGYPLAQSSSNLTWATNSTIVAYYSFAR